MHDWLRQPGLSWQTPSAPWQASTFERREPKMELQRHQGCERLKEGYAATCGLKDLRRMNSWSSGQDQRSVDLGAHTNRDALHSLHSHLISNLFLSPDFKIFKPKRSNIRNSCFDVFLSPRCNCFGAATKKSSPLLPFQLCNTSSARRSKLPDIPPAHHTNTPARDGCHGPPEVCLKGLP